MNLVKDFSSSKLYQMVPNVCFLKFESLVFLIILDTNIKFKLKKMTKNLKFDTFRAEKPPFPGKYQNFVS